MVLRRFLYYAPQPGDALRGLSRGAPPLCSQRSINSAGDVGPLLPLRNSCTKKGPATNMQPTQDVVTSMSNLAVNRAAERPPETSKGIPPKDDCRSLGRCPVPVLGSAPLRLTRRPSRWELERDARGQGFQNRGLTGTLVRDRLTVDRRTRTSTRCSVQSPARCSRAQTGAPATDQPTVDNVARSLTGYRPEP